MMMQDVAQPPLPAMAVRLTWAGLLPFLGALAVWGHGIDADRPDLVTHAAKAFIVYSAVILSFLGGIRWGRVMGVGAAAPGYVLAVLPSLWAFPALFLPTHWAVVALAIGFGLALWFDTRADAVPATPGFRTLRVGISAAVVASHALAALLAWPT